MALYYFFLRQDLYISSSKEKTELYRNKLENSIDKDELEYLSKIHYESSDKVIVF